MNKRAGAAFVRLQTPADFERTPRMKSPIYLLAAIMLLAASCGGSNNKGPEYLFVQTSNGATLTDSTLTLTGISSNTGWFTDRPYREAGQIPTEEFILAWGEGENSFTDDPPNADFTCTVDGEVINHVVELQNPTLAVPYLSEGCGSGICVLNYDITFIGPDAVEAGDFVECDGAAHLFIDFLVGMSMWVFS
jgi:hypothetical protein